MLSTNLGLLLSTLLTTTSATTIPTCPPHNYTTHILSLSPLIIYIPSFLTAQETTHLRSISPSTFRSSQVADSTGTQQHLLTTRSSQSTSLASDDIVTCIEQRALAFQGFDTRRAQLEPLQLVSYAQDQEYHLHTDWFTGAAQTSAEFGGNRVSSFFVYVSVSENIMGGGTQFPLVEAPRDERWCGWVDCDAEWEAGTVFRPVEGNAVFWRNSKKGMGEAFVGDRRVVHAGLAVQRGRKLGMNIWTREGDLDGKYRSG